MGMYAVTRTVNSLSSSEAQAFGLPLPPSLVSLINPQLELTRVVYPPVQPSSSGPPPSTAQFLTLTMLYSHAFCPVRSPRSRTQLPSNGFVYDAKRYRSHKSIFKIHG